MINRRTTLALLASTIAVPAFAMTNQTFQTNGIAINGYDPVAYFLENQPVTGTADHSFEWNGATWHFSSAENRALFAENPENYAPQFGGYCAYAASKNALAPSVPEAWTIYNNKLYLNFSLEVRALWRRNQNANIALAEGFWPGLIG